MTLSHGFVRLITRHLPAVARRSSTMARSDDVAVLSTPLRTPAGARAGRVLRLAAQMLSLLALAALGVMLFPLRLPRWLSPRSRDSDAARLVADEAERARRAA